MDQSSSQSHHLVKGMTLIETMISLMLLSIFSVAVVTIIVQVLSNSSSAQMQNKSVALAENNLELVRNFYQTSGYATLVSTRAACASGCYLDGNLTCAPVGTSCIDGTSSSCSSGKSVQSDPVVRQSVKVTVDTVTSRIVVDSWVAWMEKGVCRTDKVTTNFYSY